MTELEEAAGNWVELAATADRLTWQPAATKAAPRGLVHRRVQIPKARLTPRRTTMPLSEATPERAGGKADGLRRLAELARSPDALFRTAPAIVAPFGVMENALSSLPASEAEYRRLRGRLSELSGGVGSADAFEHTLSRLRELVGGLPAPPELVSAANLEFGSTARLMARSSANGEDLETIAGAGLYESVANVAPEGIAEAVRKVWASLWTRRAALSRAQAGIPHEAIHMAVVLQQMVVPRFSFVLHTANPSDGNPTEVYAEIVVGLGETLVAGAARGCPYRLVCDKRSDSVQTLAFANFSRALEPAASGLASRIVDYSQIELSRDTAFRNALGRRLAAIGAAVETAFGRAQDIEGAIVGDQVFLVQARAQQGL